MHKPELGVRIEASYDTQNLSISEDIYEETIPPVTEECGNQKTQIRSMNGRCQIIWIRSDLR